MDTRLIKLDEVLIWTGPDILVPEKLVLIIETVFVTGGDGQPRTLLEMSLRVEKRNSPQYELWQ